MRKTNITLIVSSCVVGLLLVYSCKTRYNIASENYAFLQSPASVENGKNLVYSACGGCHFNRKAKKFIGNQLHALPRALGNLYTANLTNSEMYGVTKHYTNEQLAYLIKTGVKKEGRFVPYMVRPNMADADINDIIAYLRSDDAAIAAGDTSVGHTHLNFIGRMAMHTRKPEPYIANVTRPSEAVADGRYLVDIMGCYHCHSKSLESLNYLHPEKSKNYMMGGMKFKMPDGKKIYGSNLTPCKTTGIGNYSQEDFRKAVKDGVAPGGRKLSPPMDKYHELSDKQVDDIFAYLQTLPRAHHLIKGHTETVAK